MSNKAKPKVVQVGSQPTQLLFRVSNGSNRGYDTSMFLLPMCLRTSHSVLLQFLVDESGSMSGHSIAVVRREMKGIWNRYAALDRWCEIAA